MIKSLNFLFLLSFRYILLTHLLIFRLNKALEINTSILFHLDFANNTILSCFFFFFLIIDLYFLILPVIAQIFSPIAELVIPTGIPTKEKKAEIETHPIIVEAKKEIFQYSLELYIPFCAFY